MACIFASRTSLCSSDAFCGDVRRGSGSKSKFYRPVSVQGCCQWKQKEAASNCTTSICRRDCGAGISRRVGCGFRRRNGSEFSRSLCGRQASVNFWRWRTQSPLVVATSAGNNSLVSSSVQVSSDRSEASSTRVIVDNESHEKFTVISVETSNRVGILQRITSTLNDLGLHILDANVELAGATVKEKFYVTDARGEKISEAEDVRSIEIVLKAALHEIEMEQPWDVPSGKTSVARKSAATKVSEAELQNKSRLLYRLMDQYLQNDVFSIQKSIMDHVEYTVARSRFKAAAYSVRDRLIESWNDTQHFFRQLDTKRVYYLSMEFLMGRSLLNSIYNLGIKEQYAEALTQLGYDLEVLVEQPKFSAITCFQDEDDREQEQQHVSSRKGGTGSKKTQEDLLERIAREVRNKRDGDRESTPIVRSLTWAFRHVKKPEDVEALVGDLDLSLSIFSTTIQKLGLEAKPMAALAVLEWLQSASGKQPNVYVYNSLLGALKANGRWKIAESVYQEMQRNRISPDIVTLNTLISMYEQQGAYTDALKIYNSLKPLGLQPSLFTIRNVIQILERKGDVETALDVFGEFKQQYRMLEEGRGEKGAQEVELKRNAEQKEQLEAMVRKMCFEKISYLLVRDVNRDEVIRLWSKMKSNQVPLSRNLCEKLIRACGMGEEDHKFVKLLYLDMRKEQFRISVSLCNHVVRTLGRGRKWWASLEVYEHMMRIGPQPDTSTHKLLLSQFRVLLNSARRRKIWKWALQLLDKMIQRGVEPDGFSWNAALIACSKAGETDAAISVFRKMIERGQRPGVLTYGALLSAFEKSNHLTGANMVWEHMKSMAVKPNIVAYTTMISACGRGGNYGQAMQLLEEMRTNEIQPSLVTFNALITACARAGDGERALDVIQQMSAAKILPDAITYAQLIEAMANEGRWEPATEAYKTMHALSLEPPTYAYEAVLRVCKQHSAGFSVRLLR